MITKMKKSISRKFSKPICDKFQYKSNMESFAGNSISNSNILIVTNICNDSKEFKIINEVITNENDNNIYLPICGDNLSDKAIIRSGDNLIGLYDHIINIFVLNKKIQNPKPCFIKMIYKNLQTEVNYFVERAHCGTISTAIIYNNTCSADLKAELEAARCLIGGLGFAMGVHNIIENGVVATDKVPMKEIMNTLIYLSSKYGQILNGEVFFMDV